MSETRDEAVRAFKKSLEAIHARWKESRMKARKPTGRFVTPSPEEFAVYVGAKSPKTVENWRYGKHLPQVEQLLTIAKNEGVSLDLLLGRKVDGPWNPDAWGDGAREPFQRALFTAIALRELETDERKEELKLLTSLGMGEGWENATSDEVKAEVSDAIHNAVGDATLELGIFIRARVLLIVQREITNRLAAAARRAVEAGAVRTAAPRKANAEAKPVATHAKRAKKATPKGRK